MAGPVLYITLPASNSSASLQHLISQTFSTANVQPSSWASRFSLSHSLWRHQPQIHTQGQPNQPTSIQAIQQAIQNVDVRILQMINLREVHSPQRRSTTSTNGDLKDFKTQPNVIIKSQPHGTTCLISRKRAPTSSAPSATEPSENATPADSPQNLETIRFTLPNTSPIDRKPASSPFAQLLNSKIGEGWIQQPHYTIDVREHVSLSIGMHKVRIGEVWGAGTAGCKVTFMLISLGSHFLESSNEADDLEGNDTTSIEDTSGNMDMQKMLIREFVKKLEKSASAKSGFRIVDERWWSHGENEEEWCQALRATSIATGVERRGAMAGGFGI